LKLVKALAVIVLAAAFSSALHAVVPVPELDPGNVMSAAMLLGGVLLVIRSRKK
jgi:hypothetical protein